MQGKNTFELNEDIIAYIRISTKIRHSESNSFSK